MTLSHHCFIQYILALITGATVLQFDPKSQGSIETQGERSGPLRCVRTVTTASHGQTKKNGQEVKLHRVVLVLRSQTVQHFVETGNHILYNWTLETAYDQRPSLLQYWKD
jgi:hypothetical protein